MDQMTLHCAESEYLALSSLFENVKIVLIRQDVGHPRA